MNMENMYNYCACIGIGIRDNGLKFSSLRCRNSQRLYGAKILWYERN